jgi:hypothetical protein
MKQHFQKIIISFLILIFKFNTSISLTEKDDMFLNSYRSIAKNIKDTALINGKAYSMLKELCYDIGQRLCGSPSATAAVEWSRQTMLKLGLENVRLQSVIVPHWERGKIEEAAIINSTILGKVPLSICALGGSIGTPELGIMAEVIEVHSLKEAASLGKKALGKIVLYNRPMDPKTMNFFMESGSPHAIVTAIDAMHPADNAESANFGMEYVFNNMVAQRGGYKYNVDEGGFAVGAGFKYSVGGITTKLDYSYTDFGRLNAVHRASIGFGF